MIRVFTCTKVSGLQKLKKSSGAGFDVIEDGLEGIRAKRKRGLDSITFPETRDINIDKLFSIILQSYGQKTRVYLLL